MSTTNIIDNNYVSLEQKLKEAQKYVLKRYDYYNDEQETNNSVSSAGPTNSDAIKKTIDDLRNKLLVNHFINADDLQHHFTKNIMNKIIKSALISGCAFVRIIQKDNGKIELMPYDAYYITGYLNNDNTLKEAISIDDTDSNGKPKIITHYTLDEITVKNLKTKKETSQPNELGIIPIVPVIVNQNARKPFGSSFITKKMMKDTDSLKRTKQRADIVSQTQSNASTYILGVSKDFKSKLSDQEAKQLRNVIALTEGRDGDKPTVSHTESGATTLEQKIKDLEQSIKYDTETPAYMDMVFSIRQDIVDSINLICNTIRKIVSDDKEAQQDKEVGIVFKNSDYTNLSALMDGVLKVNQVVPNYWAKQQLDEILGVEGNEQPLMAAIKDATNNSDT